MDTELKNKHTEKRKLNNKILEVTGKLRRKATVIIYRPILYQINKEMKSKEKAVSTRLPKKIKKLCQQQQQITWTHNHSTTYLKHAVCKMSSYELSHE